MWAIHRGCYSHNLEWRMSPFLLGTALLLVWWERKGLASLASGVSNGIGDDMSKSSNKPSLIGHDIASCNNHLLELVCKGILCIQGTEHVVRDRISHGRDFCHFGPLLCPCLQIALVVICFNKFPHMWRCKAAQVYAYSSGSQQSKMSSMGITWKLRRKASFWRL